MSSLFDFLKAKPSVDPPSKEVFKPIENKCPYCGVELNKSINRKTQCSDCRKYIYFRGKPTIFKSSLMTEEQACIEDTMHEILNHIVIKDASTFYADENRKLSARFGKEASPKDTFWCMAQQIIEKSVNDEAISRIYPILASYLYKIGENHTHMMEAFFKIQTQNYLLNGYKYIEIFTNPGCCNNCKTLHGKKFEINEQIKNPSLPNIACTTGLDKGDKYPWCSCSIVPSN